MTDQTAIVSTDSHELVLVESLPADQNPAAVYIARLTSETSRYTMRNALNTVTDILNPDLSDLVPESEQDQRYRLIDWAKLRFQHTAALKARLMDQYKPATANKLLAALRGVLEAAFDLGLMNAEDYQRARKVKNVKNETLPVGRDVAQTEIAALLKVCREDTNQDAGVRDAAILIVLWRCGLRRSELVGLDLSDYDTDTRRLTIRSGKGRKDRTAFMPARALPIFQKWLNVRGVEPGALFLPVLKSGAIVWEQFDTKSKTAKPARLTAQAIYNMLQKRGEQADIQDFSPHDMRRTLIGDLLDKGVDIVTVSKIVGHANPQVTGRYDRRPERTKRDAADLLDVPDGWLDK